MRKTHRMNLPYQMEGVHMDCPEISGLSLSAESKRGIKRITDVPGLANALAGSTTGRLVSSSSFPFFIQIAP
jgi:hypothetical protein